MASNNFAIKSPNHSAFTPGQNTSNKVDVYRREKKPINLNHYSIKMSNMSVKFYRIPFRAFFLFSGDVVSKKGRFFE